MGPMIKLTRGLHKDVWKPELRMISDLSGDFSNKTHPFSRRKADSLNLQGDLLFICENILPNY
jgi:hypothetical protein